MRYKLLGKSGLRVSELCLGTMTFGEDWGWGSDYEESRKVFDAFASAGGNFIDTANFLPMARALEIGVTAWSPLGPGVLTGKYNKKPQETGDSESKRLEIIEWVEVSDRDLKIAAEVVKISGKIDLYNLFIPFCFKEDLGTLKSRCSVSVK